MKLLVVFSTLAAVACASLVPLAQPAHQPALLLDPHGHPLDTADVINARAIHLQAKALEPHGAVALAAVAPVVAAPTVFATPAAVSHQSRVDVRTSPAIVTAHATPVLATHSAYAAPLLRHPAVGLTGHGHLLKKRSLGHIAYGAPVIAHATPVLAAAPTAVSHQSRVDVRTNPAIVTAHAAPVLAAHSVYTAPHLRHSALGLVGHGHLLKKRSLGHIAYATPFIAHATPVIAAAPAAVAHQSRIDVVSSPAVNSHTIVAPAVAHAVVAPVVASAAVSHQSRVDVRSSPAVVSESVVAAPILSAHSSLALSGHGHLLKKRSLGHIVSPIAVAHAPAAVSHQSRIDVVSRPAVVSQAVVAPVVAHAAPVVPLAHSATPILHSAPLAHAAHW